MKKKSYIAGIICTTIIICMAGVLLYRNIFAIERSNAYEGLNTITMDEIFEKPGNFYVYAQRSGCPYCDNVKDEIIQFAKSNSLFVLDTQADENKDAKDYDWTNHHIKYDEEIGEVVNGKNILDYTIKAADKDFVKLNEDKVIGKIYAVRESPIIDYTDATKDNFIIAAVPMLYHIENGNIENFYFGDAQILQFLGSNKSPLDEYINL